MGELKVCRKIQGWRRAWLVVLMSQLVWFPHTNFSFFFFLFFNKCTDEHGRSSCYLLEAIKVNFRGPWIPQTFESPTSSIMGYLMEPNCSVARLSSPQKLVACPQIFSMRARDTLIPSASSSHDAQVLRCSLAISKDSLCRFRTSDCCLQILMGNHLVVLSTLQVGGQIWVTSLLSPVTRGLTLKQRKMKKKSCANILRTDESATQRNYYRKYRSTSREFTYFPNE